MKFFSSTLLIGLSLTLGAAQASFLKPGPYLGLGFNQELRGSGDGKITPTVYAGFRFDEHLSTELSYLGLENYKNGPYFSKLNGLDALVVFNQLAYNNYLNFSFSAGLAVLNSDVYLPYDDFKQTNLAPEFAAGIDLYLNRSFSIGLNTKYIMATDDLTDITLVGLRCNYYF